MKFRGVLLVAAGAIALTAPAHAEIPGCITYTAASPWRVAQPGPDLVAASFAISNYCSQAVVVDQDLVMHNYDCLPTGNGEPSARCTPVTVGHSSNAAPASSHNGFGVSGSCIDAYGGTNHYHMTWAVRDTNGTVLGTGSTASVEITCDNSTPQVLCPKQVPPVCYGYGLNLASGVAPDAAAALRRSP